MSSPAVHNWENGIGTASAVICYATPQGCRNEEVTAKIGVKQDGGEAMMLVAAKLGEQGWELTTGTTEVEGQQPYRVLYFRRQKK